VNDEQVPRADERLDLPRENLVEAEIVPRRRDE
jgi:hypothetical protein